MHRLHIDELQHMMLHDHFAYLRGWLERYGAIIVRPDEVRVPDGAMPGTFATRPGRWGQDEPYPPYAGTRKLLEDANAKAREASDG